MTTPHTGESARAKKLVEELRFELRNTDDPLKDRAKMLDVSPLLLSRAADEIERRISTPIPITPSDEMVAAAQAACVEAWEYGISDDDMRAALQAALNLMGVDK